MEKSILFLIFSVYVNYLKITQGLIPHTRHIIHLEKHAMTYYCAEKPVSRARKAVIDF
jgi:hypothetical protein